MAQSAQRLINGEIMTSTAAVYYTVASQTKCVIKKLVFCNTTLGSVNVTIYLVPNAGTVGDDNTLIDGKQLIAGQTWSCPDAENMVLEAGGSIHALGDGVTVMGSGIEIT